MRKSLDRWLARYLKRRGWVVFWLDEEARFCRFHNGVAQQVPTVGNPEGCWLALYEAERKAGR